MTFSVGRAAAAAAALIALVAACGSAATDDTGMAVAVAAAAAATEPTTGIPTRDAPAAAVAADAPLQIPYGDDERSHFGVLQLPRSQAPAEGHPVVILVHGGFWSEPWDYTLMSPLAADLVDRGYATWNIEFRRVGGYGGYPETFDDVVAAVSAVSDVAATRPLDLERVVLLGHSSGGHLALWALDRTPGVEPVGAIGVGAIVDLGAFDQSQRLLGGTADAVPERYEFAAPTLDPDRVFLIQGADDRIVPLETLGGAEAAGVPITVVPGADHFDVIDPEHSAWGAALDHIAMLLD